MLKLDEDDGEKLTDEILQFKLPIIVFNHAVNSISAEVELRLRFIEICQLFKGTRRIEDLIYDSIQSDFPGHALCWDALAKRCWKNSRDEGDRVTLTKETYLEGLNHVKADEERKLLWKLYCGWMLDHINPTGEAVKNMLLSSCEQNFVTEELSLLLCNRMLQYGLVDTVLSLLDSTVLPCIPESCSVWMMKLQLTQASVDSDGFSELCRRAIDDMDTTEYKLRLYHYWLDILLLKQQDITTVLQEAITDTKDDSVMNRLLEWSFINGGIKSVRKSFKRLESFQPLACSVYLKYLDLEHIEGTPPKIRIVDEAIHRYGNSSADIWLKCIRAELRSSAEGGVAAMGRIQTLHLKAVNAIADKPTLEVFNHCFNEMMANY